MSGHDGEAYFDYAATAPLAEEAADAMMACLRAGTRLGNASSFHAPGRAALALVERARRQVSEAVGAGDGEIVWTSGATESNNLAIIGAAHEQRRRGRGSHVITAATEHAAVLEPLARLGRDGFDVTVLPVAADGRLDNERVFEALRPDTVLVSLMHVNNETGVMHDIACIGERLREAGVVLHVDAAQSVGHVALDVSRLAVDLVSLSSHKAHGPAGVGALYVGRRPRVRLEPQMLGGGQEGGRRSGTLPVHQVVGMGAAFALAQERGALDRAHLAALRRRLWAGVSGLGGIVLNGRPDGSAHILNVSVLGVHGEALRAALDGVTLSAGSACASRDGGASHVLRAMGRPDAIAHAALRISLGRETTERQVDDLVERVRGAVDRLRAFSPVWREIEAGADPDAVYGVAIGGGRAA